MSQNRAMRLSPTPRAAANYQVVSLASGRAGLIQTLTQMRQFVNDGRVNPAIRNCAAGIVFTAPPRDQYAEVNALFEFVRDHIRYLKDVYNVETLATAENTLASQVGDCDDQTILLCALCESIGYPTRFVVAGYADPSHFDHVYCQINVGAQWLNADPTEKHELNWAPPNPVCVGFEQV